MSRSANLITVETQVVGAVISNNSLFARASFLDETAFSDASNAAVWKAITDMKQKSLQITPATLAMRYPDVMEPLGGLSYLSRIAELGKAITTAFGEAADRLYEELQWRMIANLSARLQAASASRDKRPEQILSGLISFASKNLSGGSNAFVSKKAVVKSAIASATKPRKIVTTGITSLDLMMQGGLRAQRLYGIGGLYGRGKTILLGSVSDFINLQDVPHLFISLETPPEDIEIRNCAKHLQVNASCILDPHDPDHQEFLDSSEEYLDAIPDNTIYDFAPGATIDEIHRKILSAKSSHRIEGFILDYWQLVRGRDRGQSEDSHLREVGDRLAAICRQEDLWGIVTGQVDERGRLKVSETLLQSASLFVRLVREEDDNVAYFVTEKSNYTRYRDTGSESVPGMIFDDQVGPHFRDTDAVDIGDLNDEERTGRIDL